MARMSLLGSFAVATLAALALSAALATLINAITAGTDSSRGASCLRECQLGEHYTCRFDFRVHHFQTYSWNCKTCGNLSCTDYPGCIQADGITRLITVVNEQLPGPTIQVCAGDTVKIRVRNHLVSSGVSIHWHGLSMRGENGGEGSPHMDGEPWVTQCPINPNAEFTYTFVADPPGTHSWQAQTGFHRGDGVFGAFIVKSPKNTDPNDHLYDKDLPDHIILVNDWAHILGEEKFFMHLLGDFTDYPKSILVNGLGPHEGNSIISLPHPVKHKIFQVVKGSKYRFRLISGAYLNCPMVVSIDEHLLTVIAADGSPIKPYNVTSIIIHPGERWDFVLHANQYPQPYWISFMGQNDCVHDSVFQNAVLQYVQGSSKLENRGRTILPLRPKPRFSHRKPTGKQLNSGKGICTSNDLCLGNIEGIYPLPPDMAQEKPDQTIFFGFSKTIGNKTSVSGVLPRVYRDFKLPPQVKLPVPHINGVSFNTPSTPVIFQPSEQKLCDSQSSLLASSLSQNDDCLHVVKIPLGSITDLVLVNEGSHNQANVVHLHGYRAYILAEKWGPLKEGSSIDRPRVEYVKKLDANGQIKRNLNNPVQKDTVSIPHQGFVVLRFKANNAGIWMLESQHLFDSLLGMKVILQVGEYHEIPSPPFNFPRCGNFP